MRAKTVAIIGTSLFVGTLLLKGPLLSAQTGQDRVVRLAELEIEPAHLEIYKAALREEIATGKDADARTFASNALPTVKATGWAVSLLIRKARTCC